MIMMMTMTMTTLLYLSGMGIRETRKRILGSLPCLPNPHARRISVGKASSLKAIIVLETNSKLTRIIFRRSPFKIHESKADSEHPFNNIVLNNR